MEQLKILILEDNENDVEFIKNEIISSLKYQFEFKWVVSKKDFVNAIDEFLPDVILSDYNLPQLTGFEAIQIVVDKNPLIPFIIVTGTLSEEAAAQSILCGAWDYVVKERLHRLPRALENALKLKKEKVKLHKAEEELIQIKRQTGVQIKLLFDAINHAPSSFIITDSEGIILYVNPKFTETSGLQVEDIVGENFMTLRSDQYSEEFYKNMWATLSEGKEWKGELVFKKKNGEPYWEQVSISPILDENNKIIHFVAIKHDISEIKENERKLQISENRYKAVFENTGTATCILDNDGTISLVNPKFEELSGLAKKEIEGKKKWQEFVVKEDLERMLKYHAERRQQGKVVPKKYEFSFVDHNGNIKEILLTIDLIKDTDKSIASLLDISDRKKMEDKLDAERILLRTVIDNLPDAVYVKDNKLRKILLNKADMINTGGKEKEVIGKTDYEVYPSETSLRTQQDDALVINTGNPILNKEELLINSDGRKCWLLTSKLPLYNNEGEITGLVGICRDITQNKKMIQELIESKEKAEEMNRLKSIFLANMSHELRTPLVGMLGFAEMLSEELTDKKKEYIDLISASGERLLRTLSTILDYSKIEAGKTEIVYNKVSITDLLNDEIRLHNLLAKHKGISIHHEFGAEQLSTVTDERLLREIIDNLINNAVKFTEKGIVNVRLAKEKGSAVIKITDTGVGIPKEKFDVIFEEFRQVSEGNSRTFQGTGLGLTLVKKYLEMLNGKIEIDSEVGVGSTFSVYLPIIEQQVNAIVPTEESRSNVPDKNQHQSKQINKKILVVEDDEISRLVIQKMLDENFVVDSVANAIDAIKAATDCEYDAVLMDINLGEGMNGIETTREIKKMQKYKEKPITAITAYAMNREKEEFLSMGFSHYLAKPFKRKELLDLLNDIFQISSF